MSIVRNHWGWSPLGVYRWLRWAWAWPIDVWGVQRGWVDIGVPLFERRVKILCLCFPWGLFSQSKVSP